MPILAVRNLSVHFPVGTQLLPAVSGVSFELEEGEVLGVVGESGSGKSVTALSIIRLIASPPARIEGEIRFRDRSLLELPESEMRRIRGGKIAMIFQDPLSALNPVLNIGFQVAEAIQIHQRLPRKAAWRHAVEMLERVGLPEPSRRAHSYPHEISGGQRQRVMIAMAFACQPEIVIADEPTTALDVTVQRQVLDLMLELRRERGTAVILITHDLGVVAETADRLLVMYGGQVVESGEVAEVFRSPEHPYTRALLASVPRLDGQRLRRMIAIPGQPPDLLHMPAGCRFRERCAEAFDRCVEMPDLRPQSTGRESRCWLSQTPEAEAVA